MDRFNKAFESWKTLAYKEGTDPEGKTLAAFSKEYRELFHKHFGEVASSNQMVLMFAYLQANASAPNLLACTNSELARISADQGEMFTISMLEMVKLFVATLLQKKNVIVSTQN
jgi:hypothetical protein